MSEAQLIGRTEITGPTLAASADCERILRTLPAWFGDEESLLEYVQDAARLPTFVLALASEPIAFLTLRQHFDNAWEVHCIAVHAACRGKGAGAALHAHVEHWLVKQGARLLQVKTLAAAHPSREYAQTRGFYRAIGYIENEVFPTLWDAELPVLQLVKVLQPTTPHPGSSNFKS